MKLRLAAGLVALGLGFSGNTWAENTAVAAEPVLEQVKKQFETEFEGIVIDEVSLTPFEGIIELRLGNEVLYTNKNVDFVLQGSLVDVATRTDLTAQRLEELNRIDFSKLPLDKAIKIVKGDGSQQIAVFEDPNCIYCKRLHQTLDSIDNVTVYSFLFPILSPDSRTKSESIWCAEDKVIAWTDWMRHNKNPVAAECETPIDELLELGMQFGVQGTPAIFFTDGSRASGWLPADQLINRMQEAKAK